MSGHNDEVTLAPAGWQDPPILVVVHLGFIEVERAVFEKTVPADELEQVWYEIKSVEGFPAPAATVIEFPRS
jgi:hypothetical protein